MADDSTPWYAPNRKLPAPPQPTPGVKVWELRKEGRVLVCDLRDDEMAGAGIDVQVLDAERRALFRSQSLS